MMKVGPDVLGNVTLMGDLFPLALWDSLALTDSSRITALIGSAYRPDKMPIMWARLARLTVNCARLPRVFATGLNLDCVVIIHFILSC